MSIHRVSVGKIVVTCEDISTLTVPRQTGVVHPLEDRPLGSLLVAVGPGRRSRRGRFIRVGRRQAAASRTLIPCFRGSSTLPRLPVQCRSWFDSVVDRLAGSLGVSTTWDLPSQGE